MGINLSLKDQLTFYGAYHHNSVNQWIHIICVPLILWTAMVWVAPLEVLPGVAACWGVALVYGTFYVLLEPIAGLMYAPVLALMALTAVDFTKSVPNAGLISLGLHIVLWILQFLGHGVFEKRAPALLDSLLQSLMLAPFFVWMEVLFKLGYAPTLRENVNSAICENIMEFKKAEKGKKKAN
eukprot:Sspe_Gene.2913::Locus_967_Transcript_2_4_Confidence_0.333_Length_762::g.2913::m.2913